MFDVRQFAVRYRLGLQDTESLVQAAETLLEEGRNEPAIVELAILQSPIMAEAGPLFERACSQLNVAVPTKDEAIDELLRHHLGCIASGACQPRAGLEVVMREIYWPHLASEPCKEHVGDSRGMEHLIGAYWAYNDLMERPKCSWNGKHGAEAIESWEQSVRQYAKDWLEKHDRVDKH